VRMEAEMRSSKGSNLLAWGQRRGIVIPEKQSMFVKATMMSNSLTLGGNRDEVLEVVTVAAGPLETVTVGPLETVTVTMLLMSEFPEVGVGVTMVVAGPVKLQYRS
jgi:hypothetical protein